jgi:hypothetical protein
MDPRCQPAGMTGMVAASPAFSMVLKLSVNWYLRFTLFPTPPFWFEALAVRFLITFPFHALTPEKIRSCFAFDTFLVYDKPSSSSFTAPVIRFLLS